MLFLEPEGNSEPRIEQTLTNVAVKVGTTAELVCAAQGSPPPTYRYKTNLYIHFFFII